MDLNPAGATYSEARGASGANQVGYSTVGGVISASLWSGTAASWVNLHPAGTDLSAVVIHVPSGEIRAPVGSTDFDDVADGQVNGALAWRSPGSALKPFLFAAAFSAGRLGPESPVPDRPLDRRGYRPGNFRPGYAGMVTAAEALRTSLNLPALRITEAVGISRCVGVLRSVGLRLPPDAAARGGMALATGAVEVRLLDLTNAYATLARGGVHRSPRLFFDEEIDEQQALPKDVAAAITDILSVDRRPPNHPAAAGDRFPAWFSWKTGTSSGSSVPEKMRRTKPAKRAQVPAAPSTNSPTRANAFNKVRQFARDVSPTDTTFANIAIAIGCGKKITIRPSTEAVANCPANSGAK